jgi:hypothetical protein
MVYFYLVIYHPENDCFVVSDDVVEVTGKYAGKRRVISQVCVVIRVQYYDVRHVL